MSRVIYKYPLQIANEQRLEMPMGAEILCVQAQGDVPCIWAIVDPAHPVTERKITIKGTGHRFSPDESQGTYLGTIQTQNGSLVWHVFIL